MPHHKVTFRAGTCNLSFFLKNVFNFGMTKNDKKNKILPNTLLNYLSIFIGFIRASTQHPAALADSRIQSQFLHVMSRNAKSRVGPRRPKSLLECYF